LASLDNTLECIEVEEPLDPLWVAKKYGISKDDEHFWEYVAKEAKDVMAFLTGYVKTEDRYRDINKFEDLDSNKYKKFSFGCCGPSKKKKSEEDLLISEKADLLDS
jgi:hypothetical protein